MLFQTFTSVQQYLSISFQDPIWAESSDNPINSSYILDTTLHLNGQILENSIISRSQSLHALIPCRGQSRGFPVSPLLSPSSPSPPLFFPNKRKTQEQQDKISKKTQMICQAGTIRKGDPSTCHCPQSLGNNHFVLRTLGAKISQPYSLF